MFARAHRTQQRHRPQPSRAPKEAPGFSIQRQSLAVSSPEAGGDSPGDSVPVPVARIAAHGVEGRGGELPHRKTIERSFGRHDLRDVRAHSGSKARDATGILHADAYAMGNTLAFSSANPSLWTVAHEAAHVVQQRAGVRLPGGLGEAGDAYERHADRVAAKVVRGESAESLLSEMTGRDRSRSRYTPANERGRAVQRIGEQENRNRRENPKEQSLREFRESSRELRARSAAEQRRARREEDLREIRDGLALSIPPPTVATPASEDDGHDLDEDYRGGLGDPVLALGDNPQASYRNVLRAMEAFQELQTREKSKAARRQADAVKGDPFSSVAAFLSGRQAVEEVIAERVQLRRNPGTSAVKSYTSSHGVALVNITFERQAPDANIDFNQPLATQAGGVHAQDPIANTFGPHQNVNILDPVNPNFLFQTNFQNGQPVPVVSAKTGRDHHFAAGNRAVGRRDWGRASPPNWTWHHLLPRGRMSLVDRQMHAKHGHNGGMLFW